MDAKKIRILFVIETLAKGGAEGLLVSALARMDRDGFAPSVVYLRAPADLRQELEKAGIPAFSLGLRSFLSCWSAVTKLYRIIKDGGFNIVHTHLFFANIYGRVAAKLAGVRSIVTTLHNPDYSYEDNGRMTFRIRRFIDRWTGNRCNAAFIAVSDFVKKDFERHLGFKNIRVIYNGIDTARFKKQDTAGILRKRTELGLAPGDKVIVNVGRLHPQKGQVYLLEALKLLCREDPGYKLVIVGRGVLKEMLKKKAAESGVENRVIFLEGRSDIADIISAGDIFVFPSVYEGFGMAFVEAMCAGMPVVASDIPALAEIVASGVDGILITKQDPRVLAESISELMNNAQFRSSLGANAARKAAGFDIGTHVKKLQDFYRELTREAECIVCGAKAFRKTIYGGYSYRGNAYDIVKCARCGFMFLNPAPDKETLNSIYRESNYFENYYATSSGLKSYTDGMSGCSAINETLLGVIKKYKGSGRLLEVGCAAGMFLVQAREAGFKVSGIEPNPRMAEYAAKHLGLEVRRGLLEEADFTDNHFDIIYAADVLEHMPEPDKNAAIIRGLLEDDGIFVLNQPLVYNKSFFNAFLKVNMAFRKNRYSNNPPYHLWEFNSGTLRKFLANQGFRVIYYKTLELPAKPLNTHARPDLKNRMGFYLKNISSAISNAPLADRLGIGDRCIAVCRKDG